MTKELGFEKFWNEHWPRCRRKQKKQTWDQWKKINPAHYEKIFAAVDAQKKQPSWLKDDCAYIPYPHRWLRDKRWEDEITPAPGPGPLDPAYNSDVNLLIDALRKSPVMPADLPKTIAARFRRMYEQWRGTNRDIPNPTWPVLHTLLQRGAIAEEQIAEQYLAVS